MPHEIPVGLNRADGSVRLRARRLPACLLSTIPQAVGLPRGAPPAWMDLRVLPRHDVRPKMQGSGSPDPGPQRPQGVSAASGRGYRPPITAMDEETLRRALEAAFWETPPGSPSMIDKTLRQYLEELATVTVLRELM